MTSEAMKLADILEFKIPSISCLEDAAIELRHLHQCLRNVYEVWSACRGIPAPQNAREEELFNLVIKMRDAAKEGL